MLPRLGVLQLSNGDPWCVFVRVRTRTRCAPAPPRAAPVLSKPRGAEHCRSGRARWPTAFSCYR